MSALGRVVRSGVGRRRVQTVVVGLSTTMAVTAAVLGGSLLVASTAPFDTAFVAQHGAHLSVAFDAARVTATQVVASSHATGVTATAGPFRTVSATPTVNGMELDPMSLVGRADRGGAVDDVTLTAGRWVSGPGDLVLSADTFDSVMLGRRFRFPDLPGVPTLTVVGLGRSSGRTADGWVTPSEAIALTTPGAGGFQMLYRFAAADTTARMTQDQAAVTATVPAGAVSGAQSWLTVKADVDRNTALFVPFLIAFGLLGLVMSMLIVGNVVAGAVGAGTRRIGILKALGFTPDQVVRAYVAQALIPAVVGSVVGVIAANVLAVPVLAAADDVYGATSAVAPWVDVAVVAGVLGVVALTALAGAWRAGRLRPVDALAVGRNLRPGHGRRAALLAARLPLPRPIGIGLARPFARPARAVAMVAAIVFGATAITFAVGLSSSLTQLLVAKDHNTADVVVDGLPSQGKPGPDAGPPPAPHAVDTVAVTAAIRARSGTRAYYGMATTQVTVAGLTGSTTAIAFTGDASWGGYQMTQGTWFHGPGEAVVPTPFLIATGTRIGDTITIDDHGTAVRVRIVGEVFDTHNDGMEVLTDAATLPAADPLLRIMSYYVDVRPGTDTNAYIDSLNTAVASLGVTAHTPLGNGSDVVDALDALTALLTLMLVAVAGLGVLNGILLDVRERVRDLGVHKALGMTPRQVVAMVIASVAVVGIVGGAIGVPAGVALHAATVPAMGHSAGIDLPVSALAVYHPVELVLLGLGGLLIAVLGALLPAGWAARTRTATALRTE
jgi:putative ABC transport system permease protein